MKALAWALGALLAPSLVWAQPAASAPGTPFDGAWTVRIDCPNNTEESAAKGYRYEFPASVAQGWLTGAHLEPDMPGSLRIEGRIGADGEALLEAHGRTGNPDYAAKRPGSGTPYAYRIKARFDAREGTGTRLETRVCNFTFRR
jgi:hypothetical protein